MEDIRRGICPLCQFCEILEQSFEPAGHRTHHIAQDPAFLPAQQKQVPYGIRLRLICLRCGFMQEFMKDPELLPRDDTMRVIRGQSDGPYR